MILYKGDMTKVLEHAVLQPRTTANDIAVGCDIAARAGVGVMTVQPIWAELALRELVDTGVKVGAVVGFPHGVNFAEVKAFEAGMLFDLGVDEIDVVMNLGAFKSREYDAVLRDLVGVVEISGDIVVKVVIEASELTDDEIVNACGICEQAGADYVKTSTGFGSGGATPETVALIRRSIGKNTKVAAFGGIATLADMNRLLACGADRIATNATLAIMDELAELEN